LAQSGHELVRCKCLLLTQSGHESTRLARPLFKALPAIGDPAACMRRYMVFRQGQRG